MVQPTTDNKQKCLEKWEGVGSIPRVLELREMGVTWVAISKRFGITPKTIFNNLHKAEAQTNEKAPAPDTSTGPTTNPEGSALSVTDDGSKVPDSPATKEPNGGK